MSSLDLGAEAAVDLIERRWFALLSAIKTLRGECATLLEASKLAEIAWRRTCVQLAEFEALRDALEDQMSPRPSLPVKQTTRPKAEPRSGYRAAGKH